MKKGEARLRGDVGAGGGGGGGNASLQCSTMPGPPQGGRGRVWGEGGGGGAGRSWPARNSPPCLARLHPPLACWLCGCVWLCVWCGCGVAGGVQEVSSWVWERAECEALAASCTPIAPTSLPHPRRGDTRPPRSCTLIHTTARPRLVKRPGDFGATPSFLSRTPAPCTRTATCSHPSSTLFHVPPIRVLPCPSRTHA